MKKILIMSVVTLLTLTFSAVSAFTFPSVNNNADIGAKRQDVQNKWNTLSAAQKNEIYALKAAEIQIKFKIIDKYEEFGIIDKAHADAIKTAISKKFEVAKTDGKLPHFGRRIYGRNASADEQMTNKLMRTQERLQKHVEQGNMTKEEADQAIAGLKSGNMTFKEMWQSIIEKQRAAQ